MSKESLKDRFVALGQTMRALGQGAYAEPLIGLETAVAAPHLTNDEMNKVIAARRARYYSPITSPRAQRNLEQLNAVLTSPTKLLPDTPAGRTIGENILPAALTAITPYALAKTSKGGIAARLPREKGMIIGEVGANAKERAALSTARSMLKGGKSPRVVQEQTGWWIGKDGKWRTEISDKDFKMTVPADQMSSKGHMWEEIAEHPELKGRYDWKQLKIKQEDPLAEHSGSFNPAKKEIRVQPARKFTEEDTLLHEMQHAIQSREGMEYGTNIEAEAGSNYRYLANPGEIEARLTELRRKWAPEMRQRYPLRDHFLDEFQRLQESPVRSYPTEYENSVAWAKARGFPVPKEVSSRKIDHDWLFVGGYNDTVFKSGQEGHGSLRFKNPIPWKDGSRLSGFNDLDQKVFFGYDKNGELFTVRREYVTSNTIGKSRDNGRTSGYIQRRLKE